MKDFNRAMLEFFGHPGRTTGTTAQFAQRALDRVLSCDVKLLIVDDLHSLRWRATGGVEVSNHFKYIANEFPVTLLFERISGLPAPLAPAAYVPATPELRTVLRTFETDLTPALMSQLDEHAGEFLARQGIHDESHARRPPTDIVDGLELPGCDLGDIDLHALHRLVRDESLTTAGAACRLGFSHDAVRFVLQEQPAPPKRSAMWERGATIRRARAALPRDKCVRLCLEEYRTLKWIAKHADVNEEAIKVLVREYGMIREGKATRWRQIDLDRLRDQRAAGRTCRELAEETGFSLGMISCLGRRHDMPGRRSARKG
ncbi:TniB family NTP-binding protein [Streptomyces sp. MNU89]|uniref:TniB family NTP-binding protein n=1 Tax=Streptomyces sp. MNU89 TaxID=2560025 RepID=UPI001E389FC6|nr:TniB family NTP-binding protein [Streptomyces sp. MNU89]MCC9737658.1 TniB family NTP-binding protein [Streptomyces sp. MNU89]